MATIFADMERFKQEEDSSSISLRAILGDKNLADFTDDDDDADFQLWKDGGSLFTELKNRKPQRRLKSLKGGVGINGYFHKHPPAQYTFIGRAPTEGNYHAKSLIKIPEPGFDRPTRGLSCGEALMTKPSYHWESSRANKSLFIPRNSFTSPRLSPRKSSRRAGFPESRLNASTTTMTPRISLRTEKSSTFAIDNRSLESREHTASHFKVPRTTPVTGLTPISITLDLKMLRKDSFGDESPPPLSS